MIGLVLVTHGRLAVEFRSALEHVVGPQGQIEAVTIGPDDDVEERRKDIIEAVKRGLARDPKTLPRLERAKPVLNGQATVELLKVLLRMTSERHGVAAKVIATVDDLDRIAADDAADVPALSGWRRELFGEKALALKHGRLMLAIEKNRVVAVERD